MHELQVKRKENIEKLTHLIESEDSSSEEKKKEEKLAKLVVTKIEIQKQIDILVESIYLKKWCLLSFFLIWVVLYSLNLMIVMILMI